MILLKVVSISGHRYKLMEPEKGKSIVLSFDFYQLEYEVEVGDYLVLADCLIDEKSESFSPPYSFSADLEVPYGRSIENLRIDEEGDLAVLIQRNKVGIALKRLYG